MYENPKGEKNRLVDKLHLEANPMEGLDVKKNQMRDRLMYFSLWYCFGRPHPIYHLKDAMLFSSVAYCEDHQKVRDWTCIWCEKTTEKLKVIDIIEDENYDSLVYVGYNSKYVIISFRGTKMTNLRNWWSNLNVQSMPFPHGNIEGSRVHAGFYTSYLELHTRILAALSKAPEDVRILITGHSRGGALGEICAAVLSEESQFRGKIDLISYGKPRVGNEIFVKRYSSFVKNQYRVVNRKDVVPHVVHDKLFIYTHPPTELWFENDQQNYRKCDGSGEDKTCSYKIPFWQWSVDDHMKYVGYDLNEVPEC
eukprot:gene4640-8213_t